MVADYYAMLGANPGADRATLESALARCQPVWSSGTRNPKTKHTFQSYLDQIPEIRRVLLGDAGARATYDAELQSARRADRDRKLDELQRLVKLRAAKGGLTVGDRTLLRDQAEKLDLEAEDLDRLIELIPPKPEAPVEAEAIEPVADVLDAVIRKQIRVALDHLRRLDLYDALGVTRDAPSEEITASGENLRRRWMQKTQVTAEKTAWLEVVSHAQSHLGSRNARERYDRTLGHEAEERLNESIAFAVKGLVKLDYGTRKAIVDEAGSRGITPERADVLITRGCRTLGVARDAAPALIMTSIEPPRFLRCRACSGVTDFEDVSTPPNHPECRHCRGPLQWTCPACRRVRWVDEPRCPCGFPLEQVEPLHRHFEAAQVAHRAREFSRAMDHLKRVQQYAPGHSGARKAIETVRRLMGEAESARLACESARAKRQLVAARAASVTWGRLVPEDQPEFLAARDEVLRALKMAQALAARGRAAESDDPKAARGFYEKALHIAADLDEAREGVLRCPPDPPTALLTTFESDRVRLRWTPPAVDGLGPLTFRVVRKREGVPEQPNDGATVAETADSEVEDRAIQAGQSVGYAVFSVRSTTYSKTAATAGPVAILPDVTDVRVDARAGEVAIDWKLPKGSTGVRVARNLARRPIDDHDGTIVEALPESLVDVGLQDDRVHHYRIFAVYPAPDGSERLARGVAIAAIPHPPVEAVGAPSLLPGLDGRVRLFWNPPPRGTVRILRTTRPLPEEPGTRVPSTTAASWEGEWLEASVGDQAEDPSPPTMGICYYTPIVAWSGGATVGHFSRYSCVADPSDLRAVRAGNTGRVHLRWRWSPQGMEARVVAKAGSPPIAADDPQGLITSVSDEEYSRLGYFGLTLPPSTAGPWHLAVFSVSHVQGEEVVSPGLDPSARTVIPGPIPEVTVAYHLRRPGFPGRLWSVTFRTDPEGASIPPTALVAHPRTVPLSADDGEVVARFPASTDGETFTIPANPALDLARYRARIFPDPASDPDSLPPIRLRHPEHSASRV